MQERIQKILSRRGIASRRKAEEMIQEGMVTVNGVPAVLGMKADPEKDHIKVRGKLISRAGARVYLLLNKPVRCITALSDPEGRTTIKEFLPGIKTRVFPVGRLDYNSEGLLLLTNDGDMANAILHPRSKIPKTYLVKIDGVLEEKDIQRLQRGIRLEDGMTVPAGVKTVRRLTANSWIEVTIHEGRKRQVRRMLEQVGHPVIRLMRTRINGLQLGKLRPGQFRHLTPEEVKRLKRETGSMQGDFQTKI